MSNIGLVLEGGGFRGVYTAGVLDVFLDNNIEFKYHIGVSAGACNVVSYISKQRERSFLVNYNYCNNKDYCSRQNLLKTGSMFGEEMMFHKIPDELMPFDYDTYEKSDCRVLCGVTNCNTGKPEYFSIKDLKNNYDKVKASSWLPFISKMVDINGEKYLDGGVTDSIPLKKSIDDGNDKNVVVLTRPIEYRKEPTNLKPLAKLEYRNYKNLQDAIINRHIMYNDEVEFIKDCEQNGKAFVIRPSKALELKRLEKNPENLKKAYELGISDALNVLDDLKKYIAE